MNRQKKITLICMIFIMIMVLTACGKKKEADHVKELYAMDTFFRLEVNGKNSKEALKKAVSTIKDYEKRFSVTNPSGEIGTINQEMEKGVESFALSRELKSQFETAREVNELTNGAFDITIYPVMKAWGFTMDEKQKVPADDEISKALQMVGMNTMILNKDNLVTTDPRVLDLGGICKGYTGKQLAKQMKSQGIKSAILSLGGNVQTIGKKENGKDWVVGITDPNMPESYLGSVSVGETSVITSGSYQRNFEEDGATYHHIMDPSTGRPADNTLLSVTVIGEDGALGDALSTGLFVLGEVDACGLWRQFKKSEDNRLRSLECIFVTKDNRVMITEGLKDSFQLKEDFYSIEVVTPEAQ